MSKPLNKSTTVTHCMLSVIANRWELCH